MNYLLCHVDIVQDEGINKANLCDFDTYVFGCLIINMDQFD